MGLVGNMKGLISIRKYVLFHPSQCHRSHSVDSRHRGEISRKQNKQSLINRITYDLVFHKELIMVYYH